MAVVRKSLAAFFGTILFLIFSPVFFVKNIYHVILSPERHSTGEGSADSSPPQIMADQNDKNFLQFLPQAYANTLITVDEALQALLPEADHVEKEIHVLTEKQIQSLEETADLDLTAEHGRQHPFFTGMKNGKVTGYAAQDVVPGKWGPIYYMIGFEPDGTVRDVIVVAYEEKRGRPVAERRFLKQFFGKDKNSDIKLMKDIRGVTGASISSNGMTDGIRKMVHIWETIYGKK